MKKLLVLLLIISVLCVSLTSCKSISDIFKGIGDFFTGIFSGDDDSNDDIFDIFPEDDGNNSKDDGNNPGNDESEPPEPDYIFDLEVNDDVMGSVTTDNIDPSAGDSITLNARPNYGYIFVGWYIGEELLSDEECFTYTMPENNVEVMAVFDKDEFVVRVTSANPEFQSSIIGAYKYLTDFTVVANDIEGSEFFGWYINGEMISSDKTLVIRVKEAVTVYAEYYAYGAQEVYDWPTVGAVKVGTPLSEVELSGGKANILGYFEWADPDAIVYPGGEYIVVFVPYVTGISELETMISVPVTQSVLEAPTVSIDGTTLVWNAIEGAESYDVIINGVSHSVSAEETTFELPTEIDEYYISVVAVGDNNTTVSSDESNIERYVPEKPSIEDLNYGQAKSQYNEDGELVKYGGTVDVNPDNFELFTEDNVIFDDNGFTFDITVDIGEYISATTKRKILDLNKFNVTTDVKIALRVQIEVIDPKIYAELDMDFPLTIEDLAFGVTYKSMVTTVLDVSVNGEFVEPELRRGTLHLLFIELVGLEEPLYKWAKAQFRLRNTPVQVEFALCFDAVGAIAAKLSVEHIEVTNYSAAIYAVKDGVPIFVPYFNREVESNITKISLAGELDVSLNCVRLSASLQLTNGSETISVLRLNLDAANIESDLSGEVEVEFDTTNPLLPDADAFANVKGSYYFYGQVTFEFYLEIKIHFPFLPLDGFGIKLIDGSYILAEWEYAKGGIPNTPYRDEAVHITTPIFATDGKTDYYIDLDGELIRVEEGKNYFLSPLFADLDGEEIVDIDDCYIYVLSGNKLRRIGRTAATERTIITGVSRVIYSDRTHIYYTTESAPNVVKTFYRSDMESDQETFVRLPGGISAIRMRYDYLLECYVIYAENGSGNAYYFSYDGVNLQSHGENEHKWWDNVVYEDGSIAFFRQDKDGNITECFIRGVDGGVTHADNVLSVEISPIGIFTVIKKEGKLYDYELGLYPLGRTSGSYLKIAEVCDPNAANRVIAYDGEVYVSDIDGNIITVYKTDGKLVRVVAISELPDEAKDTSILDAEIHGDWLFIYTDGVGNADVIYAIDVYTLDTAPYIAGSNIEVFDKGNPSDITYTLGGNVDVLGVFINKYNDEEFENLTDEVKNYIDRWNDISTFLEDNFDFWKSGKLAGDDIVNYLNEYGDFLFPIEISIESFEPDGDYLGNLTITASKDIFTSYSYGLHSGYIVTTMGIFDIKLNVVDSRDPSYSQEIIPSYDKGDPSKISFEIYLYDSEYSFENVSDDAYEVKVKDGYYTFTFYPHFLSTLDYGEQTIVITSEGEPFEFKLLVEDSRTPKDSEYRKYFDLTYPKNVVFKYNLYDEKYIASVEGNDIPVNGAYTISDDGSSLTLLGRYLETLSPGEYVYTVTTAEDSFEVTVVVIRSLLPVTPDAVTHDMGLGEDLGIDFEKNDAKNHYVYINGKLLSDDYWIYSFVSGKILINNDYLLSNYDYGRIIVTVRSTIYSGDDIKAHANNIQVTLTDSRAPKIVNDEILYVIRDTDNPSLTINLLLYGGKVNSVVADSSLNLPFGVYNTDLYRRSATIQLNSMRIIDVLSEGEHNIEINIDGVIHSVKLTIIDERMPKIINSSTADYNIDYPSPVSFIVRLYGERFISLVYGEEALPDDAYTFVHHSDNSLYHILIINQEYLESLELGYSQTISFTINTNVNSFDIKVVTGIDPTNNYPDQPDETDKPTPKPNPTPLEPPVYTPVDVATSITLSPDVIRVDKANVVDVVLRPNYGSNNSFGGLQFNLNMLVEGSDFSIGADDSIILSQTFLKTLTTYGNYTLTLRGAKGKTDSITIVVFDSRVPYTEEHQSFEYDKFLDNTITFDAVLYDSKVSYIRVDDVTYKYDISSNATTITLKNALLDKLSLGEHTAYIGFNDTAREITITLITRDTGLYLNNASVDKAAYADDEATLTLPWTLYEGNVDACTSETLTVVAFDNTSVTLSGFFSAAYKNHSLSITANGREFELTVSIYDSRKPYATESVYSFDKGSFEYSLDPFVTKDYDVRIVLELYDESISGLDMFSNQTIRGNGLEYKDYEREGNDYLINYLYLYRLPVGDYKFYISTTDGNVEVNISVTDSKTPYLKGDSYITYDWSTGEDLDIDMFLYGDNISSLTYVDIISGNKFLLVENEDYLINKTEEGTTLTLLADFFADGFFDKYTYKFELVSVTERTLKFEITIANGPRRPFSVTYYSVPWKEGEPDYSIESLILYEGDMIPVPETPYYRYYNFLGFYTERTGGQKFDFSKPINSDCDIFLHWEPMTYKITLISDGNVVNTYNVKYLSNIPNIPNLTKAGYTFIKWSLDPEHEIRFNLSGETMPHRDIMLYAEWQINQYTVIFKDKNGVVLKEEILYAYEDATPPLDEDMQVEHYEFLGWDKNYTSVLSDIVCSAVYTPVKYEIGYNLGEGSLPSGAPMTYTIEGGVKLPTPYLTGYDFLGWYLNEEFTGDPVTSIDFGTLPGFNVYAKFEVATYNVYLNSTVSGVEYDIFGAPIDNKLRITFEDQYVLPRVLVPNGYFFLGWFSGANGTGTRFSDYLGNSENPWSYAGDITLYAYVVSLLDIVDLNIVDYSVSFGITTFSGAEITVTSVELYHAGELVASIAEEDLTTHSYSFTDLFVETVYEIKLTYSYTIPDVDGERSSYSTCKIRIVDDKYPSTVIGHTVAEIQVGSDLFASYNIDSITVTSGGEVVSDATVYYPGNTGSCLSDGTHWVYILDLNVNTEYEVIITYHYTLANYAGYYTSTMTLTFTTGTNIFGLMFPIASVDVTRVSDGSDSSYYYYTYEVSVNFDNAFIENNVRVISWELLRDSAVVTSGETNTLISGGSTFWKIRLNRSYLSNGYNHEIKFTYTYDLQDGLGTQYETVVYAFNADTSDSKPSSGGSSSGGGGGCLVTGTDVLMADGSIKKIEDVEIGDPVLVWNFYTGNYDVSPVHLIHTTVTDKVFYLEFANGKRVGVGISHYFFVDGRFEEIYYDNASDFIGRSFLYEEDGNVYYTELVSVDYSDEEIVVYSLISNRHYNHFANGFLSVIPVVRLVNIFEYDGLKYDEELMASDLEKYGYMDYSHWSQYASEDLFYAFAGEYLNVAIGKGNVSVEYLVELILTYFYDSSIEMISGGVQ